MAELIKQHQGRNATQDGEKAGRGHGSYQNVREGRREIGILIALGATAKAVLVIFMMKAVFLTLVGGLLGYGMGTPVAFFLAPTSLHIHVYPSLSVILPVVLTAVFSGPLSRMVPSWRALRMDPAEIVQET